MFVHHLPLQRNPRISTSFGKFEINCEKMSLLLKQNELNLKEGLGSAGKCIFTKLFFFGDTRF